MDPLSEVLQSVRLTGAVFLEARFTAPWCVSARVGPEDCRPHLAQPVQVIAYHYVVEGVMVVSLDGVEAVEVRRGQTVLLPRNDPHVLGSAPGLPPVDADRLMQPARRGGLARIVHGGGGARTRIVCGFLGSDQARHPLVAALPRLLTVDMAQAGSGEWIESSLRFALRRLAEGRLGAPTVMSRLSELMLVEAVRCYAATLPADRTGWLAGLRDRHVGRALALIHGRPQHPWTTAGLAREVGLSRSAFADRFASLVGMPPKRYLTAWRLQLAQDRLRAGAWTVAQVAYDVGYEAEAAFIRAFKREFGVPPATWRRTARDPA